MPYKRSAKGKQVNAQGTELKAIRLDLDATTHRLLRIEAAKREMSMAGLVRALVEEYVAKHSAK
jgi:hypothetical protein